MIRSHRKFCRLAFAAWTAFAVFAIADSTASAEDQPKAEAKQGGPLNLHARSRVETEPGSGRWHAVTKEVQWDPAKTAVVICDMWDKHWCQGATGRVGEMAPRMNEVVKKARDSGALIIHCPSDTMEFYKSTPQRKLAESAPVIETQIPLERWCRLDEQHEGKLPIDDSDGGCDCQPMCKNYKAWSRQIADIEIQDGDAITDSGEAYYLMKQRGIENVIVMGVHTNMCVLGRPFSIRQMVRQGRNVLLVRDMTDTMYNPRSAPRVSHFTGTDLVVEHIERHWCPTISSVDFLGGEEFRFKDDHRPHVVIVMAEPEYKTEQTLPEFAAKELGNDFRVTLVYGKFEDPPAGGAAKGEEGGPAKAGTTNYIPGLIEAVADADVLFLSVRRRALPHEQMAAIEKHIKAGKPVVGIRTTSHAFSLRGEAPPVGYSTWETFDAEIIGGNYTGHHGDGPKTKVIDLADSARHPILEGVNDGEIVSQGSLYKSGPLKKSAAALLWGQIPDQPIEPIAWTNTTKHGGRVFYTSLGHIGDFEQPEFRKLLKNAIAWAAKEEARTSRE